MRKIRIEFIRSELAERGYRLLSTRYVDANSSLDIECPIGHKIKMCWVVIKRGGSCIKCFHDSMRMDINFIKKQFEKEGYTLLTTAYKNSKTRLDYLCSRGHKRSTTWGNWNVGNRCGICACNVKHTIEFVRSNFEKENYILITDKYINQKQKLDYVCPKGHYHSTTWTDWYNGNYRCPTCRAINMMGEGNHQWKGGKSFEGYCPIWKTKGYRENIKKRDGHRCLNPYCNSKNSNDLTIHHIDYDKGNCGKNNLITICRICNIKANKDRNWHTSWYRAIMARRYNYKY